MIRRLGLEINNPNSVFYWCAKNDIPGTPLLQCMRAQQLRHVTDDDGVNDFAFAVFCPAITDGSLGDMIYFHSFRNPGLIVDIAQDIRALNNQTVFEKKTGMIIIGGGVVKHHICNANLMRNGAVCQPCISRLSVCVRVCHVFFARVWTQFSLRCRTGPFSSTRATNSTGPTAARGRMRPSVGARSASEWRVSKCKLVCRSRCVVRLFTLRLCIKLRGSYARVPHYRGHDVCQVRKGARRQGAREEARGTRTGGKIKTIRMSLY